MVGRGNRVGMVGMVGMVNRVGMALQQTWQTGWRGGFWLLCRGERVCTHVD